MKRAKNSSQNTDFGRFWKSKKSIFWTFLIVAPSQEPDSGCFLHALNGSTIKISTYFERAGALILGVFDIFGNRYFELSEIATPS